MEIEEANIVMVAVAIISVTVLPVLLTYLGLISGWIVAAAFGIIVLNTVLFFWQSRELSEHQYELQRAKANTEEVQNTEENEEKEENKEDEEDEENEEVGKIDASDAEDLRRALGVKQERNNGET